MDIEKVLEIFAKSVEPAVLSEHFILWAGDNLVEVCRFAGLHKKFMDWFPSWGDYVKYVQEHDNIFKVFTEGGYYEVPVGSWLVKAPDGLVYPCGEGVKFVPYDVDEPVKPKQKEVDEVEIPIHQREEYCENLYTFHYPEDPYETEVVQEGNSISLRHKLDKDGKFVLKKTNGTKQVPSNFIKELEKFKKRQE